MDFQTHFLFKKALDVERLVGIHALSDSLALIAPIVFRHLVPHIIAMPVGPHPVSSQSLSQSHLK